MKLIFAILCTVAFSQVISLYAEAKGHRPTCFIQAFDGHYLTAVDGGGRTTDVIHSDANRVSAWEKIRIRKLDTGNQYIIRTSKGFLLTVVGGGGRSTDLVHTDTRVIGAWEKFRLIPLAPETFAIETSSGHYLTAQDAGGRVTDVIHSNARTIGAWERFRIVCDS